MSRVVVITGSASGIGRAARQIVERAGHRVIGVDLHSAEVLADLATPAGRKAMIDHISEKSGGVVDGVIASAGVAVQSPLTVAVNYFGALATLEGLRPLLAKGVQPRAVIVTSLASVMPSDEDLINACLAGDEPRAKKLAESGAQTIYASTKAAIVRWMRCNATQPDWIGEGIVLNGVAPGVIVTPMTQAMIDDPDTAKMLKEMIPMPNGRYGLPEEIGYLLAYLVSPENSLMVGQVVFADGGSEAAMRGDGAW